MHLAERSKNLRESPTLALQNRVVELKRAGKEIISFALGEPDFDTPRVVRERGKQAIDEGRTHYTPNRGIEPLRNALRQHLRATSGIDYPDDAVIVSSGSKFALWAGMQTALEPGDEVLMPTPVWVSTPEQLRLAGAVPVPVPCRELAGFVPNVRDLEAACTPRTRMISLCNPHNPTGAVYPRETLEAIARLAIERNLVVITDEIYQGLVYGDARHHSIAGILPGMAERTLVVWGVAKSFAMTGWRIGLTAGPADWINAIDSLQSQVTSCASSISQYAALQALLGASEDTESMRQELDQRRLYMVGRLRSIPGLTCAEPFGAFYVFPNFTSYFGRSMDGAQVNNAVDLCLALLEHAGVAAVPGDAFEAPGYLRLCYSVSQNEIETGLDRIEDLLKRFDD